MLIAEPTTRRWKRWEYHELAESGYFDEQRVELIDGEIVVMAPQNDTHAYTILRLESLLRPIFSKGFVIRTQMPLVLGADSEPEPDVAIVRGKLEDQRRHPTTAELLIEVSDTTLRFDRTRKTALYAAAGIREYWIVNLVEKQLELYRNPQLSPVAGYGDVAVLARTKTASPLALPKARIKIADIFA